MATLVVNVNGSEGFRVQASGKDAATVHMVRSGSTLVLTMEELRDLTNACADVLDAWFTSQEYGK